MSDDVIMTSRETWIEKTQNTGLEYLPYKFTGKEMDEETGLYYYGARYLDPKYSRWISVDPALGEYIPAAGKGNSENAGNLPGMGGIYNHINGRLYHYAGNNPVCYIDPDGRETTQKDFYWNGQYVSTTTVSTKTTTHYFSVNELNNFISDIQKSKSHKNIMDKHIYEKAKDAFGFTSLTTSIIEPVVKSTFKEIADAYLYIFFAAADLDNYLNGGDFLEKNLDCLWNYQLTIENEFAKYGGSETITCINKVTVGESLKLYSSEQ